MKVRRWERRLGDHQGCQVRVVLGEEVVEKACREPECIEGVARKFRIEALSEELIGSY